MIRKSKIPLKQTQLNVVKTTFQIKQIVKENDESKEVKNVDIVDNVEETKEKKKEAGSFDNLEQHFPPASSSSCETWYTHLSKEFKEKYWFELISKLNAEEKKGKNIYPPIPCIFKALHACSLENVRVVLLGQDCYHSIYNKQPIANGLSFSSMVNIPPSLGNIYKEISSDLSVPYSSSKASGNLTPWAAQGVLLLNSILTVNEGDAGSHKDFGWLNFTDEIISCVSQNKKNVVFLLWGAFAQSKTKLINSKKHLILTAAHPSPLSAEKGFFGCKHFSKTNQYLLENGSSTGIDWTVTF